MQQKAVKFSLPSKKNKRHRQCLLAVPCYFGTSRKLSADCLREDEERGGEGGRWDGTALSPKLPKEGSEPQAKHVCLLILRSGREAELQPCTRGRARHGNLHKEKNTLPLGRSSDAFVL